MNKNPQALVLDFGGVITRMLFETHAQTERTLGLPPGSLTWRGPFDPASDPLWQSMQRDEITERDYWHRRTAEVGRMLGRDWTSMSDLLIAARGDAPAEIIRPEFRALLAKAQAAGLKLAILSNELDLFYGPNFRGRLDFIDAFDVIHDATYTKVLKPAAAAYEGVVAALGLPAGACVFIDDQARNIKGAAAAGMIPVHFDVRDPAGSFETAARLLGID